MKEKIIMFVLGFLAGAIITTAIFLITSHNNMKHLRTMGGPGSMQMQERHNSERSKIPKNEPENKEKSNKKPEQKLDDSKTDIKEKTAPTDKKE